MSFVYWARGATHIAMADRAALSARRTHPGCHVFMYVDDVKGAGNHDHMTFVRHLPASDAPLMVQNIDVMLEHCASLAGSRRELIWFLDADTLIASRLDGVSEPAMFHTADLFATWRTSVGKDEAGEEVVGVAEAMPYNFGVLGVRPTAASIEALCWMKARILAMGAKQQQWYGNQLALAELLGHRPSSNELRTVRVPWHPHASGAKINVELLDGNEWNYTPQAADEPLDGRRILHFKGARRELMRDYERKLLEFADMERQVC